MTHKFTTSYLEDSLSLFRFYKEMVERTLDQVSDEEVFAVLNGRDELHRNHHQAYGG